MGVVHGARHLLTGERLAIKLLLPRGQDPALFEERFRREVSVASRIRHPGIVRVQDAGRTEEGELYLVMERLEGGDLEAMMRQEGTDPPGARRILGWLREAMRPLNAAHLAGIVHRDLKPANVFVHRSGGEPERIVLLDFGIARYLEDTGSGTQTDMGVGTVHYMSPEQATEAKGVHSSADLWSVGIMLYRALTGNLPFVGATPYVTLQAVCQAPLPPCPVDHPLAQRAWPLIEACLQKNPAHRPVSAEVLGEALDAVLEDRTAPSILLNDGWAASPRTRLPWFAILIAFGALLLGGAALWAAGNGVAPEPPEGEVIRTLAPPDLGLRGAPDEGFVPNAEARAEPDAAEPPPVTKPIARRSSRRTRSVTRVRRRSSPAPDAGVPDLGLRPDQGLAVGVLPIDPPAAERPDFDRPDAGLAREAPDLGRPREVLTPPPEPTPEAAPPRPLVPDAGADRGYLPDAGRRPGFLSF